VSSDTFLGRPVEGEVGDYSGQSQAEQWDADSFKLELDAVLAHSDVVAVIWKQYTPYFNDGDACVFDFHGLGVALKDAPEDAYADDEYYDADTDEEVKVFDAYSLEDLNPELAAKVDTLEKNLAHYETVLHEAFGDPAEVVATSAGFKISEYDHD
jgi:hypothetical protein